VIDCYGRGEEKRVWIVGRKARRKETLGRARDSWMNNSKMDRVEIGGGGLDWIGLAQDKEKRRAFVNAVMNFQVL
jgi:hypothetical protein